MGELTAYLGQEVILIGIPYNQEEAISGQAGQHSSMAIP